MNEELFLNTIKKTIKDSIREYEVFSGTYGNIVFEINKEWIFRFSREDRDIKQLEIEKYFLKKFEKISPIPVPCIEYEGENFIGYRRLEGVPFTNEICESISKKQRNDIWESIGKFLNQLHSTNFKHENLVEYPFEDNDFWNDLWSPIKQQLSKKTREKAFQYFTEYFKEETKNPVKKTICHADFHPNHILFNKQSKDISGIIDFGRICINDPAIDFNLIERFFGEDAIKCILQHYKHDISGSFRSRITFQNRRRLFAAFFYARLVGETSSFPRYLERIENVFTN
jgi:aminoglycoside 2''-phosphotransferase